MLQKEHPNHQQDSVKLKELGLENHHLQNSMHWS